MKKTVSYLARLAPVAVFTAATPASANTAANYNTLTAAVNWGTAIQALMAVAAVIAGVLVVKLGIKFVLGILRGGG